MKPQQQVPAIGGKGLGPTAPASSSAGQPQGWQQPQPATGGLQQPQPATGGQDESEEEDLEDPKIASVPKSEEEDLEESEEEDA